MLNFDRNENSAVNNKNIIVNDNTLKNESKSSIKIWSQMTVGRSLNPSAQNITQSSTISHVLPIYYIPVPPIRANAMNTMTPQQNTNQFSIQRPQIQPSSYIPYATGPLPNVIYPPVTNAPTISSMIYASPLILKMPSVQNDNTKILKKIHSSQVKVDDNRPESQATSIKAQPGSIMAMSESSKKRSSPCSSLIDLPVDNTKRLRQIESSMEDSSDSSFYGSFLNTSSGSSWNPEQSSITKKNSERYISRSREDEMTERRHFSIVNELKANFELQTARRAAQGSQKMVRKCDGDSSVLRSQTSRVEWSQQDEMLRMVPPWLEKVNMTSEIIYQYQMSPRTLSEVLEADMNTLKNLHQPLLVNHQLDQLYLDLELEGFDTKLILEENDQLANDDGISDDGISSNISPQEIFFFGDCLKT
ncbi:hypothetical protein PV326_014388 [Microctonus aethiopoides]|nr:hypothetical protein PV326_014388 [Microctonus aethiopoides]